jgi:hypothetical protein
VRRAVVAVVLTAVVATLASVLAVSARDGRDEVLDMWTHSNRLAVRLVALHAHVRTEQINCGQYGGYVGETGTCNFVRRNGQCEQWRYDVRGARREVSRVDRTAVPERPPDREDPIVVCIY